MSEGKTLDGEDREPNMADRVIAKAHETLDKWKMSFIEDIKLKMVSGQLPAPPHHVDDEMLEELISTLYLARMHGMVGSSYMNGYHDKVTKIKAASSLIVLPGNKDIADMNIKDNDVKILQEDDGEYN